MESEEFEQIPWANLVAEQTDGIDKRIYVAAGVVGILIVAVLGVRLLSVGGQPEPPAPIAAEVTEPSPVESLPPTPMVAAEADLRADDAAPTDPRDRLVEVSAEWFVTDWYTRDGSEETMRSIRAVLSSELLASPLPHEAEDLPGTFVEWAKTIETRSTADGSVEVTVGYRLIRETEDGFVREPVETVAVTIVRSEDSIQVVSLPAAATSAP